MKRLFVVLCLLALPHVAAAQQPETVEYYGQDAIGSIRIVWDANGNVIGRQDFTPFGTSVQLIPPVPREGFEGQAKDDESNQAYFHARMLSAIHGRFSSTDPVEAGMFEPQRWNRYAYALNNPEAFGDWSGLLADSCADSAEADSSGTIHASSACPAISTELWLFFSGFGWSGGGGSFGGGTAGGGGTNGGGGVVVAPSPSPAPSPRQDPTRPSTPDPPIANSPVRPPDCPKAPVGPRTASLDRNISEAQMMRAASASDGSDNQWFYNKVRNAHGRAGDVAANRSWDYKQLDHQYEDFTNFNFGATGQAAGYSWLTLATGSLGAHFVSHRLEALSPRQLMNEAGDQIIIWRGFQYAAEGCAVK